MTKTTKLKAVDLPDTPGGLNAKIVADIIAADGGAMPKGCIRDAWAALDPAFATLKSQGQSAKVTGALKVLDGLGAIKIKGDDITLKARCVGPSWPTIRAALAA